MRSIQLIITTIWFFFIHAVAAQPHDLIYYQTRAHENNPVLKENNTLQQVNLLQSDLTYAQIHKPRLSLTSDYLFAPFFANNGHPISITTDPSPEAYGYDVGLTNGGLYAAQLNAELPLLTKGLVNVYNNQISNQNQLLQNDNSHVIHELDKNITDQYIAVYQWQQVIDYQQKIIDRLTSRKEIIQALVQKGLMPQSEYLLLEIDIQQRQYDVQQGRINLSMAFGQLNNTSGIHDTTAYSLLPPLLTKTDPINQYNYRYTYQLDSTSIVIQQQIFNTKYRPQLLAFGNTGINAADAARIPHNVGVSAGLHLEIPLYDGGQKKIVEQQNKLLIDNLHLYRDQNDILIQNNLNTLEQQMALTAQSISMIDSQLSSQETLLQMIKDKVVTGQISVTDYLLALQNYADSNQNKIQAQSNLWLLINQYNAINW